eukprot:g20022.t1
MLAEPAIEVLASKISDAELETAIARDEIARNNRDAQDLLVTPTEVGDLGNCGRSCTSSDYRYPSFGSAFNYFSSYLNRFITTIHDKIIMSSPANSDGVSPRFVKEEKKPQSPPAEPVEAVSPAGNNPFAKDELNFDENAAGDAAGEQKKSRYALARIPQVLDPDDYAAVFDFNRTNEGANPYRAFKKPVVVYEDSVPTPLKTEGGATNLLNDVCEQCRKCGVPLPGVAASEMNAPNFRLLLVFTTDQGSDTIAAGDRLKLYEVAARKFQTEFGAADSEHSRKRILETPFYCEWVGCYLHALQLNIKFVINLVDSFCDVRFVPGLTAWRKVVDFYMKNREGISRLAEHVKTRWGSAFKAIEKLHTQGDAVKAEHERLQRDKEFAPEKKGAAYFRRAGQAVSSNFFALIESAQSVLRILDNHTKTIQGLMVERRFQFRKACRTSFQLPRVFERIAYFLGGAVEPRQRVFLFCSAVGLSRKMHLREKQFQRDIWRLKGLASGDPEAVKTSAAFLSGYAGSSFFLQDLARDFPAELELLSEGEFTHLSPRLFSEVAPVAFLLGPSCQRTEARHSTSKRIRREAPAIGEKLLEARCEIRSDSSLLPSQFESLYKIKDHRFEMRGPVLLPSVGLEPEEQAQPQAPAGPVGEKSAGRTLEAPLAELEHLRITQLEDRNHDSLDSTLRGLDKAPPGTSVSLAALPGIAAGDVVRFRYGCGWQSVKESKTIDEEGDCGLGELGLGASSSIRGSSSASSSAKPAAAPVGGTSDGVEEWGDEWWLVWAMRAGNAELRRVRPAVNMSTALAMRGRYKWSQGYSFELVGSGPADDSCHKFLGEILRAPELRKLVKQDKNGKAAAPGLEVVLERVAALDVEQSTQRRANAVDAVSHIVWTSFCLERIYARADAVVKRKKRSATATGGQAPGAARASKVPQQPRKTRAVWENQWRHVNASSIGTPELKNSGLADLPGLKFYLARPARGKARWQCHLYADTDAPSYATETRESMQDGDVEQARITCAQRACCVMEVDFVEATTSQKLEAIKCHQALFLAWHREEDAETDAGEDTEGLGDESGSDSDSADLEPLKGFQIAYGAQWATEAPKFRLIEAADFSWPRRSSVSRSGSAVTAEPAPLAAWLLCPCPSLGSVAGCARACAARAQRERRARWLRFDGIVGAETWFAIDLLKQTKDPKRLKVNPPRSLPNKNLLRRAFLGSMNMAPEPVGKQKNKDKEGAAPDEYQTKNAGCFVFIYEDTQDMQPGQGVEALCGGHRVWALQEILSEKGEAQARMLLEKLKIPVVWWSHRALALTDREAVVKYKNLDNVEIAQGQTALLAELVRQIPPMAEEFEKNKAGCKDVAQYSAKVPQGFPALRKKMPLLLGRP